jgi:7,8-dihydropterin-6-yl-methyl-4-(beta-D-ribofuranosyl)aminobenzene 5'-phosphate synthase
VISHGHYDHGGGLKTFLGINNWAKLYLHLKAFEPHYANRLGGVKAYIGLDESLLQCRKRLLTQLCYRRISSLQSRDKAK